jgi:hypothetical protein
MGPESVWGRGFIVWSKSTGALTRVYVTDGHNCPTDKRINHFATIQNDEIN